MSSVVVVQEHDRVYFGADTAISTQINDQTYRLSDNGEKIYIVDSLLIFCSGNMKLVESIIGEFKKSITRNIEHLQYVAKSLYSNFNIADGVGLEILAGQIIDGKSITYQISPYNSFEIVERKVTDGVGLFTGGIKTEEAFNEMYYNLSKGNKLINSYKNTYDSISYEGIGGNLLIYQADKNGIKKIHESKINDKDSLKTIEIIHLNKHLIVGERIFGKIIAGVNLAVENESGKYTMDENGFTIKGGSMSIEDDGNGISLTPENGIVVTRDNVVQVSLDQTNGFSIKKYNSSTGGYTTETVGIDINGDAIFKGKISASTISGSSIEGSTMNLGNGNFTVDSYGNVKFKGEISGSNIGSSHISGSTMNLGNGKFVVDSLGNVYVKGDITGSSGTFSGTVSAATITGSNITGGTIKSNTSIDITTDIYVGNNIYLSYDYANRFNEKGLYFIEPLETGYNTSITGTYLKMDIESNTINLYGGNLVRLNAPSIQITGNVDFSGGTVTTSQSESGYCGVGGVGSSVSSAIAGVGVNFKMNKNYTPSSVSLYSSSNNTSAYATGISSYGFWLYVNGDGTANYKYWRGDYYC